MRFHCIKNKARNEVGFMPVRFSLDVASDEVITPDVDSVANPEDNGLENETRTCAKASSFHSPSPFFKEIAGAFASGGEGYCFKHTVG